MLKNLGDRLPQGTTEQLRVTQLLWEGDVDAAETQFRNFVALQPSNSVDRRDFEGSQFIAYQKILTRRLNGRPDEEKTTVLAKFTKEFGHYRHLAAEVVRRERDIARRAARRVTMNVAPVSNSRSYFLWGNILALVVVAISFLKTFQFHRGRH